MREVLDAAIGGAEGDDAAVGRAVERHRGLGHLAEGGGGADRIGQYVLRLDRQQALAGQRRMRGGDDGG
jgi:hypothetical protein